MIYLISYLSIGFIYSLGASLYNNFFKKKVTSVDQISTGYLILGFIVGSFIWPFMAYFHVNSYLNPSFQPEVFSIKQKDLIEAMSVLDVEVKEIVYDPLNAVQQVPFGHLNSTWEEFKANYSPSTLWSFKSEYKDYSGVVIKEGYAKLEDDGTINTYFIHQNYSKPIK
ncbi:hypothetical protein H4J38_06660 [Colwellia sp. BRX10-3]|uniref:hypothetical protein n=1 Tax=Colwellia sp. BRX10-3 TaxID=2759844 RepID=UPI0015F58682|nr:hypothetical protein [Colwellia sp. BRX10-3]MBA6390463.1 hypothetical protein [Colwellia sp. BRX10-3]